LPFYPGPDLLEGKIGDVSLCLLLAEAVEELLLK
jgi:hypothetical protein